MTTTLNTVTAGLRHDQRGVSAVEFAMVAPVLFGFLMGAMDLSRAIWARSIIEGELQRAGRESTLETGRSVARQSALNESIKKQIKQVAASAVVTFERTSFDSYKRISQRNEDFIDSNANGTCDAGETFQDVNGNGAWDADAGSSGQGGGEQVVKYTVKVTYPRIFPMGSLLGWGPNVELEASTIMRNQPYSDKAQSATGNCT